MNHRTYRTAGEVRPCRAARPTASLGRSAARALRSSRSRKGHRLAGHRHPGDAVDRLRRVRVRQQRERDEVAVHVERTRGVVGERVTRQVVAGVVLRACRPAPDGLPVLEAECARLLTLGAARVRLLPADDYNESCLVMQDVEGNEFCLD